MSTQSMRSVSASCFDQFWRTIVTYTVLGTRPGNKSYPHVSDAKPQHANLTGKQCYVSFIEGKI